MNMNYPVWPDSGVGYPRTLLNSGSGRGRTLPVRAVPPPALSLRSAQFGIHGAVHVRQQNGRARQVSRYIRWGFASIA